MNKLIEQLYYSSPIFIQNIAVTLLGMRLRRERYSKPGKVMFQLLKDMENGDFSSILEYQGEEFKRLVTHAVNTTPFYNSWAKENRFNPSDIQSISDIKEFPIISKTDLRNNPKLFLSNDKKIVPHQFSLHTSGTTGSPLTVVTDKASRSRHYAFFTRLRSIYNVGQNARRATLFGRIIMPSSAAKPPFWRYDLANNNLLMSSYHLNEANLFSYYKQLVKYRPEEIFSYPSSIYRIADFILKNGLAPIKAKLVMTTAENLQAYQKDIILQAFDAPLVNQYGCTEMAFFCAGNSNEPMKFHPEHGLVEVRTAEGAIDEAGEGELVATGFINYSMPVIRYLTGDNVTLGSRDARGWQVLREVSGRMDDTVYTLDKTPVGRLDPIFKGGRGIKYSQIFQDEKGNIEIRVVPEADFGAALGEELKSELRKRVGPLISIELKLLPEIEKEKNGKFRAVISEFKP